MAGLSDYFVNGSDLSGAYQGGQQNALAQQAQAAQTAQTAQTDPLKVQQMQIANQQAQGNLDTTTLKNQFDQSQYQNNVDDAAQKHLESMDSSQLKMLGNYGQKMGTIGAALQNVPAPARVAAFTQFAKDNGIGMDRAQDFLSGDPNTLPQRLQAMSKDMITSSGDYLQKQLLAQQEQASALARTKYASDSSAAAAKYTADKAYDRAGIGKFGDQAFETLLGKRTARDQYAMLLSQAQKIDQADPIAAQGYRDRANQIQNVAAAQIKAATPGSVDLSSATGMATQGAPDIAPTPKTAPSTPKSLADAVKAAGQTYDPNNYDYRISPDGKVQRKAK